MSRSFTERAMNTSQEMISFKLLAICLTFTMQVFVSKAVLAQAKPGATPNWGTADIQSNPQTQPSFRRDSPNVIPGAQFNVGLAAIEAKYKSLGGPGGILVRSLNAIADATNGGKFARYINGSIYWHPKSGAHYLSGAILANYAAHRLEKGALGYPITDPVGDNTVRTQQFQSGAIIWKVKTGALAIYGPIYSAWLKLGNGNGIGNTVCGFPLNEETVIPVPEKKYTIHQQDFNFGGIVYFFGKNTDSIQVICRGH